MVWKMGLKANYQRLIRKMNNYLTRLVNLCRMMFGLSVEFHGVN